MQTCTARVVQAANAHTFFNGPVAIWQLSTSAEHSALLKQTPGTICTHHAQSWRFITFLCCPSQVVMHLYSSLSKQGLPARLAELWRLGHWSTLACTHTADSSSSPRWKHRAQANPALRMDILACFPWLIRQWQGLCAKGAQGLVQHCMLMTMAKSKSSLCWALVCLESLSAHMGINRAAEGLVTRPLAVVSYSLERSPPLHQNECEWDHGSPFQRCT